jgi:NAD dependent epimerase/dehydratase family
MANRALSRLADYPLGSHWLGDRLEVKIMRILITGGAGFIGSYTVDALLAENSHDVSVIDDLSTGKRERLGPRVPFHHADSAMLTKCA